MKCPYCENEDIKVLDSRSADKNTSIRRRRECLSCKKRFTTYERCEDLTLMVIKKDNKRESFNRNKVLSGMIKSCEKTKVTREELEKACNEIEIELCKLNQKEVTSKMVGELIMEKLKKINKIAYVRFASVYREFKDVESFSEEIKKLK